MVVIRLRRGGANKRPFFHVVVADSRRAASLLLAKRDSGWKVIHEHFSYSAPRRP